jgi:effector-binding domain-containing protein
VAEVTLEDVDARATIVVAAATTWDEFPRLWKELLDEVWACLRASGIERGARNVMLYRDDVPNVEVGVLSAAPCELTGRVTRSSVPAGTVAKATHRGSFAGLGLAHRAVTDWCATNGRRLSGARWEVYGPHSDDPDEQWVEVSYLLA